MHELSITRSIVAIVNEHAAGRQLLRVRLHIGKLSGMMPEAVRFCYDMCAKGTTAEGAVLEIDEITGLACCESCGLQVALAVRAGKCAACGGILKVIAGEELLVKEIEMDTDVNMEKTTCA